MENATKALLIAAAVLIAIMVISLGLVFLRMGQDATAKVNLDELTITQHNQQFQQYEGTRIRGTQVNALINRVISNNSTNIDDESLQVEVTGVVKIDKGGTTADPTRVPTGKVYTVTMTKENALITSIAIEEQSASGGSGGTTPTV